MFNTLKTIKMKRSTLLLLCMGIPFCMLAQQTMQADSLSKLQDSIKMVTVTATRTSKDIMDVGRDVTVISSAQIKNSPCNTLAELLAMQAGIFIVGQGQNPGNNQNIFLRGADDNHTTIMIDGVPVTDPSSDNGSVELSQLTLADVDRIEIVRGSHSTLYGSSSIGGVINIITSKSATPGFHANVGETAGEFGTGTNVFEENLALDYTFKNGLYIDGGYYRWDDKGLSAAVDTLKNPLPYQQNPHNDFHKGDVFSKIGYKDSKLDAFLEYRYSDQTFGIPEGAFLPANNYMGKVERHTYTGFINYTISPQIHIQYIGGIANVIRSYLQDTTVVDTYNDKQYQSQYFTGNTVTNDLQFTYDIKTSHLIAGVGSNYETMDVNTVYWYTGSTPELSSLDSLKPHQDIYNAFAQVDLNGATFNPDWKAFSLLLGARYSTNSTFGNNVSYEINPYVNINKNSVLFFNYATGFNVPSLYQLYAPNDISGDPITLGNSSLTPETSSSYEFGIKHKVANVSFTLSYFNTVVSNYIDYVYLWNKNKPIDSLSYTDFKGDTYLNVGKETTKGIEMNVAVQLDPKFVVSGNVSILSSSLEYSDSAISTKHTQGNYVQLFYGGDFLSNGNVQSTGLLRRPGTLANIILTYMPIKKLSLSAQVKYVGARTDAQYNYTFGPDGADAYTNLPDYTLLDLYASYKISKAFSTTLRVENVLNTTYYEILGYSTLGRAVYLNLNYAF